MTKEEESEGMLRKWDEGKESNRGGEGKRREEGKLKRRDTISKQSMIWRKRRRGATYINLEQELRHLVGQRSDAREHHANLKLAICTAPHRRVTLLSISVLDLSKY
jgi:hypothetical protein